MWKKSDPELVRRFDEALPDDPRAERKKMFGYPACFVNGNFFVGLHEDAVVARLPGGLRDRFAPLKGAAVFDPMKTGKGMKDWFVIPAGVTRDARKLAALLADMFAEVLKLPPKAKRPTG